MIADVDNKITKLRGTDVYIRYLTTQNFIETICRWEVSNKSKLQIHPQKRAQRKIRIAWQICRLLGVKRMMKNRGIQPRQKSLLKLMLSSSHYCVSSENLSEKSSIRHMIRDNHIDTLWKKCSKTLRALQNRRWISQRCSGLTLTWHCFWLLYFLAHIKRIFLARILKVNEEQWC